MVQLKVSKEELVKLYPNTVSEKNVRKDIAVMAKKGWIWQDVRWLNVGGARVTYYRSL